MRRFGAPPDKDGNRQQPEAHRQSGTRASASAAKTSARQPMATTPLNATASRPATLPRLPMVDVSPSTSASTDAIDRVVHDPTRLRILSCLYLVESADFLFLMRQLGLTKGNLSSHMTRLDAAGYVSIEKGLENNRPKTLLRLAPAGRNAVEQYVGRMQQLLDGLRRPAAQRNAKGRTRSAALKPRLT